MQSNAALKLFNYFLSLVPTVALPPTAKSLLFFLELVNKGKLVK